jgi:SAM-dependent methyltransferase
MNSLLTAWNAYEGEPLAARLHVVVRALTCPFGRLIDRFPTTGAVLDVGCGHGLLVNLLARDPSITMRRRSRRPAARRGPVSRSPRPR